MYGLRVVGSLSLLKTLEPIHRFLDTCWWYLGGAGVQLPLPRQVEEPSLPQDRSAIGLAKWREDNGQWFAALEEQALEYAMWLDDGAGYRVGLPGWYSRYVEFVDTSWELYFACESTPGQMPRATLDWLDQFRSTGVDWFGDASRWLLPMDVALACRNVDDAYWDVFFRDQRCCSAVREHLRQYKTIECSSFVEHASETLHGRRGVP